MSKQQVRAKLLDALLSEIILPPLPPTDVLLHDRMVHELNAVLRSVLSGAVCIEATNVARFFNDSYVETADTEAFWGDLKCLVPPHRKFFVEWEGPQIPTTRRMGMLFMACQPELADEQARTFFKGGGHATPAKIAEFRRDIRCRWIYLTLDFLEFACKNDGESVLGLRGPYHVGVLSVAEDGALLNVWMSHASVIDEKESTQVASAALVAWTTLAMMNCANIDTVKHQVSNAFQKARRKSGKRPLVSYHTVRVDLDKTPRQVVAKSLSSDGTTPRRHKKRGHMKDYRGGKGLFGRYKGVWYWGPMLAGSESEGTVVSDYEVRAGAVTNPPTEAAKQEPCRESTN